MHELKTAPRVARILQVAFLFVGCATGCEPPPPRLPTLNVGDLHPTIPWTGVVPCSHPAYKDVAFDAPTALGLSAQQAFTHLEGSCAAGFKWTGEAPSGPKDTEISVKVVLDRNSAVEITHPPNDLCSQQLTVEGNIEVSTADGQLAVEGRSTFTYLLAGNLPAGAPNQSVQPAELTIPGAARLGADSQAATEGRYTVRVGGGDADCAGEVRFQELAAAPKPASTQILVGMWSVDGCPLGEKSVEPDDSPALSVRMEQLAKAWRNARLDAAWETGDHTQLELDVTVSDAPLCQRYSQAVSVPVDVRYGTSDGVVPMHTVPGTVMLYLASTEANLSLTVEEQADCSQPGAPPYCETLSSASSSLSIQYPNTTGRRLGRLSIDGQLRGSTQAATPRRRLSIEGTPYQTQCLITTDCALNAFCEDGLCRLPAR